MKANETKTDAGMPASVFLYCEYIHDLALPVVFFAVLAAGFAVAFGFAAAFLGFAAVFGATLAAGFFADLVAVLFAAVLAAGAFFVAVFGATAFLTAFLTVFTALPAVLATFLTATSARFAADFFPAPPVVLAAVFAVFDAADLTSAFAFAAGFLGAGLFAMGAFAFFEAAFRDDGFLALASFFGLAVAAGFLPVDFAILFSLQSTPHGGKSFPTFAVDPLKTDYLLFFLHMRSNAGALQLV